MSESAEYAIGAQVSCEDGPCGELVRVVVDPIKRAITHLAVEQRHGHDIGRLVPVDLVETATEQALRLRCTLAKFGSLDAAEETEFIPASGGQWGYQQHQMMMMPLFGLGGMGMLGGLGGMGMGGMGMGGMGMGGMGMGGMGMGGMGTSQQSVTYDKVPQGEVEVRRGQHVHASDGPIGHVRGLVVDPSDHQVTHVLLDEGHLWGKREVSIPISAVLGVGDDGVRLNLTKAEVTSLPPVVDVEQPGGPSGEASHEK
jgi:sporulation protein YlmC with PRC-barrel domain